MGKRWDAWKAKHWHEEWVGGWRIPPLRLAANWMRSHGYAAAMLVAAIVGAAAALIQSLR